MVLSVNDRIGLPPWVVLGLAALAVPRAIAHDAGLDVGVAAQLLLTFGPPAVWIFQVLRSAAPAPLIALLAVGTTYGLMLGVVHLAMWDQAFASTFYAGIPSEKLGDGATAVALKAAVVASSVFTGAMVGLLSGGVAHLLRASGTGR